MSFTVVEFIYGYITNSLGLTADAVHMLFDSTAIIFSLSASVVAKWDPDCFYTYGYGRVETMTGFINALALFFASWNIIWEAFQRLASPQELNSEKLLLVSILGLLVNIVGIFAFDHGGVLGGHSHGSHNHDCHGHSHGSHNRDFHQHDFMNHDGKKPSKNHDSHVHLHGSNNHDDKIPLINHGSNNRDFHIHGSINHDDKNPFKNTDSHIHFNGSNNRDIHGHSHDNHNHGHSHVHDNGQSHIMQGMFLHVLADALGSVSVIISSLLIQFFGWNWSDPLCSIFIAVLICYTTWPLLINSGEILLQRVPTEIDIKLESILRDLSDVHGILGHSSVHVWSICHGKYTGSIKITCKSDISDEHVRSHVLSMFQSIGVTDLVIQIEKDTFML